MRVREGGIAIELPTGPKTFVGAPYDGQDARPGNGVHIAYIVGDRSTADAFHVAALAHRERDEGAPRPRPHTHPDYCGA